MYLTKETAKWKMYMFCISIKTTVCTKCLSFFEENMSICHSFPVVAINISKGEQRQTNITLVHFRVCQMEMPFKPYYILCYFVSMHAWGLSWARSNSIPEYKKLPQTCIFLRFNLQFCIIFVSHIHFKCFHSINVLGNIFFVVQQY